MCEIGLDQGRSEGNGVLMHNLVQTGHTRERDLIKEKHLRHENELREQSRGDLRVHDDRKRQSRPSFSKNTPRVDYSGVLIMEVRTYITLLLRRNGKAIVGGDRRGVATELWTQGLSASIVQLKP